MLYNQFSSLHTHFCHSWLIHCSRPPFYARGGARIEVQGFWFPMDNISSWGELMNQRFRAWVCRRCYQCCCTNPGSWKVSFKTYNFKTDIVLYFVKICFCPLVHCNKGHEKSQTKRKDHKKSESWNVSGLLFVINCPMQILFITGR